MQSMDHHVTWREFTTAFHQYYIPTSLLNRKLSEFLELKQGNITVMEYVNKSTILHNMLGLMWILMRRRWIISIVLSCILQEKLYTGGYQTFAA